MSRSSTTYKPISLSGNQSDTTVWDPAAGKKIHLYGVILQLTAAGTLKLTEGNDAAGTRILNLSLFENGGVDHEWPQSSPIILATDAILKVTTTGGGNLVGTLFGTEV